MSKWTKGPWTMKRGEVCAWDEEEKSVIPLASVYRSQAYCQGFAPESEDQHNANMMAAAPELYEALEEFAKMFVDTKKYPDPETITTGLRILLPKAREALRKARGEKA